MTTPQFQACIGPSATSVHIHIVGEFLTLCNYTSAARSVSGTVKHEILCKTCIKKMAEKIRDHKQAGDVTPKCYTPEGLAQAIGLEKII